MVQSEKMEKQDNKTSLKKEGANVDKNEDNIKMDEEDELEEYNDNENKIDEEDEEDSEDKDASEENDDASGDNKPSKNNAHFDSVDIFFYTSMAIIGDLGDSIWVTRVVFAPATVAWLYLKGVDEAVGKNIIAQLTELIPFVGWLPISTIAAVLTIWQTNDPESFKRALGLAADVMEKIKKLEKFKKK